MKIKDFLDKELINLDLKEVTKEGHLREMVAFAAEKGKIARKKVIELTEKLMERENMGSTGIGEGVAIPHIKTDSVDSIIGILGVSREGIEFDSLDGAPVFISFVLLSPFESRGEHLEALSQISLFLKDKYYRQELRSAEDAKEALKLIKKVS